MNEHLLITYSAECAERKGHVDPNFTQLVYGNSGRNGDFIKKHIQPGSYIFFNARIGDKRYITAYFYVEKILIKGVNDCEINALNCDAKDDEVIIIGSRAFSKILTIPLVLDKALIMKLKHCNADEEFFRRKEACGFSELKAISDATLNPRLITEEEKEMLIDLCKDKG
jgi:hypothetical protein